MPTKIHQNLKQAFKEVHDGTLKLTQASSCLWAEIRKSGLRKEPIRLLNLLRYPLGKQ